MKPRIARTLCVAFAFRVAPAVALLYVAKEIEQLDSALTQIYDIPRLTVKVTPSRETGDLEQTGLNRRQNTSGKIGYTGSA